MRLFSGGLVAPTQRTIPDFELRRPRTVADATGVRITQLPLSPQRVFAALRAVEK